MESTSTTNDLAHFINVACIIWSKITSWAWDVNSRDRDETLVRLETEKLRPRPHPYRIHLRSWPDDLQRRRELLQLDPRGIDEIIILVHFELSILYVLRRLFADFLDFVIYASPEYAIRTLNLSFIVHKLILLLLACGQ